MALTRVKNLLLLPYQDGTPSRYAAAFGVAIVNAGALLYWMLTHDPFITQPVELLGCLTYYHDLNIANRLAAVSLSFLWALVSFQVFLTGLSKLGSEEDEAQRSLGFFLLPVLVWLASIAFRVQVPVGPFWMYLSCALCWCVLFYFPVKAVKADSKGSALVIVVCLGLSVFVAPALMAGIKPYLLFIKNDRAFESLSQAGVASGRFLWLPPVLVALSGLILSRYQTILRLVAFPVQVILLLFFALIIPGVFSVSGEATRFYPTGPTFWVIVLPLFLIGLWDCIRRCWFQKGRSPFSPFPLLGLLFLVFFGYTPLPGYSNLYEFGSRLPVFWEVYQGRAIPFKDVFMTYGLWDYAVFYLTSWFSGSFTAAAAEFGSYLLLVLVFSAQFLALCAILPVGAAFLICLWISPGAWSAVIIYFSLLFIPGLMRRPGAWILVWALLSGLAPFARIPQGTICVVAGLPAFVWQAIVLHRTNRKDFIKIFGILIVWALMFFIGPFSDYFWGLIRTYLEIAGVNSPWAANSWSLDQEIFLKVLLGNAVIAAPLLAAIAGLVIWRFGKLKTAPLAAFMVFSLVTVYALCAISYGFSRVDGCAYLRQLQVLFSILPVMVAVVLAFVPKRSVFLACTALVLICISMMGQLKLPTPGQGLALSSNPPGVGAQELADAGKYGLPHLGIGKFPPGHLGEEQALKKSLDRFLTPKETFLDLTMVGLHYFSSQRPMVTPYPVYYVYPGDAPQFRAIKRLRRHNVRASLLETLSFDDSPSSLRAHYLYRYGLLNGIPFQITPSKSLLMPLENYRHAGVEVPEKAKALELLDRQFPERRLNFIPVVWGRGYQKFAPGLDLIRDLGKPEVTRKDFSRVFHYPMPSPMQGVKAGLLVLDIAMDPNESVLMTARWTEKGSDHPKHYVQFQARAGTLIVPLDASPRWLLGRDIDSLELHQDFSLTNAKRKTFWNGTAIPPASLKLKALENSRLFQGGRYEALNDDPMMYFGFPETLQGKDLLARVVMDAPPGVGLTQVYFKSSVSDYNEKDSEWVSINPGRNEIYLQIPAHMTDTREVRIDLGNAPGVYTIHSLQVKPVSSDSGPPPLTITRATLWQRHMVKELGLDTLGPWEALK